MRATGSKAAYNDVMGLQARCKTTLQTCVQEATVTINLQDLEVFVGFCVFDCEIQDLQLCFIGTVGFKPHGVRGL